MTAERVVLDTNVVINPALQPRGPPRAVIDAMRATAAVLLFSNEAFAELRTRLLHSKFDRYLSRIGRLVLLANWKRLPSCLPHSFRIRPEFLCLCVAHPTADAHIALPVSDEGPGVPPARLLHLFRRHAGVGEGATAGHCLGLVILKGPPRGAQSAHTGRERRTRPRGACRRAVLRRSSS